MLNTSYGTDSNTLSETSTKEILNETRVAQLTNSDDTLKSTGFLVSQNSTFGEEYMQATAMVGREHCCGVCWPDFCSPVSGNCYVNKNKKYYKDCSYGKKYGSCCNGCQGSSYCSPVSGTCYAWKNKDYYERC